MCGVVRGIRRRGNLQVKSESNLEENTAQARATTMVYGYGMHFFTLVLFLFEYAQLFDRNRILHYEVSDVHLL